MRVTAILTTTTYLRLHSRTLLLHLGILRRLRHYLQQIPPQQRLPLRDRQN